MHLIQGSKKCDVPRSVEPGNPNAPGMPPSNFGLPSGMPPPLPPGPPPHGQAHQ
ncbi:hypothetical protein PHJA_002638400 [Phtheirospermum japonicum]|uniref:Uncharacterized protein n=1 Tax=Phtheirospermum japonicum TaxID=374723 RepID=A0A830D2T0_9LAMI|nr:hypothetical protein PHJA_002638400 [Phtheirospermum japonicum]